jgi:hypothetical protein
MELSSRWWPTMVGEYISKFKLRSAVGKDG